MARCAPLSPLAGPAETMVGTVDCFIQTNVQAAYAGLSSGGFAYALTIALTIYVAIVGYRLIFGRSTLTVGEMAPRMLLIGALLALTSSWGTYQILVYDVLTDGPEEITSMINPGAGKQAGLTQRIDVLSARMVDLADAWTEFDARVTPDASPATPTAMPAAAAALPPPALPSGVSAFVGPRDSLGPNMLLISALLLILGSAGVLVVAKIILGLLLMVGPIFALLALFGSTRGLTLGWGRAAVMMALVPLLAMMTSAGAVALLEPMLTGMIVGAGQGIFSLQAAVSIMVVVILMLVVAVQMFRIGRTIVGGWTLPIGPQAAQSTIAADAVAAGPSANPAPMFNERIQSLVGSIERATLAGPNAASAMASAQRTILLPQRADSETGQSRGDSTNPDRRLMRPRVSAQRAPIKPFRSAA